MILKKFLAEYNEMKNYNPRDNRLAGFSHAINCHKQLIDDLQGEINKENARIGAMKGARNARYERKRG